MEVKERRERARELKVAARLTADEGGTSRWDLGSLINELIAVKKSVC